MNSIESYTPEFVLRLQQIAGHCGCPSCKIQPSLITRRWHNQVRHSARLGCDRAAREILCREDAFVLHCEPSEARDAERLDPRLQAVNQAAINLAVASDAAPELLLYAVGILISKGHQLAEPDKITALGEELTELMQQGVLTQAFDQLPQVDTWKLAELRALSRSELDASLDPLTGMTLVLKLNEINVLSTRYLQEMLKELEQAPRLAEFMHSHRSVFINTLLYEFYHHVFPGADDGAWEQQYHRLCQRYFSLKMLCALFVHNDLELDDDTIAALFAAWQRTPEVAVSENPLLSGITLLR